MKNLWEAAAGRKAYMACTMLLIYAVSGFVTGNLDANQAIQLVMESGIAAAIRHGIG